MEKSLTNNLNMNNSIIKIVFNREFVISDIIPVIIFSVFDKLNMTLNGIILSGVWSIGVVIFNFIKEHKINALATIGYSRHTCKNEPHAGY